MLKLFLVIVVFGCCLVLSLRQLYRGMRFGKVTGLEGGKGRSYFVEVEKSARPFAFWGFMLQQVLFTTLVAYALWMGLFQKYVFAECQPTIAYVQPDGAASLLVYWNRPDRIDDPIEYVIYRGHKASAMREVARREGGAADGQFIDGDVKAGTEYTYQVEARYGQLTQWLLSGRSTRSDPASGMTWSQ